MREKYKKHPHNQYFLVRGACFYHEKVRILNYKGVRTKVLCYFEFYRTAIKEISPFLLPIHTFLLNLQSYST